ncbi:MAG: DUF721 domain-containing protein [Bryobacterales bacterium]|nr:DUF721 domain-containing protein [Bryobacterales bacterium]
MERASRILGKLQIKPVEVAGVKTYHLAPGAWAAAVGKKIASHTKPVFLQDGKLIVDVEDAVWQTQLRTLETSILPRIEKIVGSRIVEHIEFRLTPPRRQATAASAPRAATDESTAIPDPVMRRVYRSARRKANA